MKLLNNILKLIKLKNNKLMFELNSKTLLKIEDLDDKQLFSTFRNIKQVSTKCKFDEAI
jgi:hypothetical protein